MTDHKDASEELSLSAQPQLCAGNCGFFGNSATANMCSVCYKHHTSSAHANSVAEAAAPAASKDVDMVEAAQDMVDTAAAPPPPPAVAEAVALPESQSTAAAQVLCGAVEAAAGAEGGSGGGASPVQVNPNRCYSCNKRVGLTGFQCKCDYIFCGTHRHSNKHNCTFDFKALGRDAVAKANPAVITDKVERI